LCCLDCGERRIVVRILQTAKQVTKGGIRSAEADEIAGLDLPEMGVLAYPEFSGSHK